MKIGILGTRGIPNHYGGFEQFAEQLSVDLVKMGHEVWVYNSASHPYQETDFQGVNLIHCGDPEGWIGTAGQFIYDFNCILDSRKRPFEILLVLGYTSSSIWSWLYNSAYKVITNMDGLEWKRTKYSPTVQFFLKHAEKWAVQYSHALVADSKAIQVYLKERYQAASTFIPYGAKAVERFDPGILSEFNLQPFKYSLLIARMEPENNISIILEGYEQSQTNEPLLVIGNSNTGFGKKLQNQFRNSSKLKWLGPVYNMEKLNSLRHYGRFYFHGHSVGGTNPSLLEAMASQSFIIAHDNPFNKAVLENNALYFQRAGQLSEVINSLMADNNLRQSFISGNLRAIELQYQRKSISRQYEALFHSCLIKG